MNKNTKEIIEKMNYFKLVLKRAGMKLTPQRMEIFRYLVLNDKHPDVEAIYASIRKRLPSISLDTVYRTLLLFLKVGLIATLRPLHEKMRFDANISQHHHYLCTRCGRIQDFYSTDFDALMIPESVKAIGSIERTQIEIQGICLRCVQKEKRK